LNDSDLLAKLSYRKTNVDNLFLAADNLISKKISFFYSSLITEMEY